MKSLAIIDVAGIFFAQWHVTKDLAVGEAFSRTIERVTALRAGYDHVAICLDSPPYRRKQISAAYKAQRDKPPENLLEQYARTKARLVADGYAVFAAPGYEADDLIATLVTQASRLRGDDMLDITVISADKDCLQLVYDEARVSVLSTASGQRFNNEQVRIKFGVYPAGMLDFLALCGDKSDNVPGVPGVGPKTAALVVNSPEGIEGAIAGEPIEGLTPRLREAIVASKSGIDLARKLIALETDAPVSLSDVFEPRTPAPLTEESWKKNMDPEDAEFEDEVSNSEDCLPMAAQNQEKDTVENAEVVPPKTLPKIEPKTALARVEQPVSFDLALEPKNATAAMALAEVILESRMYPRLPSVQAIYTVILRGRELGLTAGAALDNIHFFEGKPALHAHLIVDRAKRHPDCEYFRFVAGDDTFAEYETKHRKNPEPTRLRYTIKDAQRAGVCPEVMRAAKTSANGEKDSRGQWEKRPAEMLRKTCAVQLARVEYPGASGGLYAVEELDSTG